MLTPQMIRAALRDAIERCKRQPPTCAFCDETEGLRQTVPPEAPTGPDYICDRCFMAQDDGPCFDDLSAA